MNKYVSIFIFFFTLESANLNSAELTFECSYEVSQLNFAPTKEVIYGWNTTYKAGDANGYHNLCRQRELEHSIRTNNPYNSFSDNDYEACKVLERKKIFIDTETGFFKINNREYQADYLDGSKKSNGQRECFEAGLGETKLCKDTRSDIIFEEDTLLINIYTKYKPDWCPVLVNWSDLDSITNKEEKDQYIEVCMVIRKNNDFDGDRTFIKIDRNTLQYEQEINVQSLYFQNNKLKVSHPRGYGFKAVWASRSDIEEELGSCKLLKKQF